MGSKEREVELYLISQIKKLGGRCYKWRAIDLKGAPDRICILPWMGTFFVEVKTLHGKTTQIQEHVFEKIKKAGGLVFVAQGKEGIDELINTVLRIKNGEPIRDNSKRSSS